MADTYLLEDGSGSYLLESGDVLLAESLPVGAYWLYSDDDGRTWSDPELVIADVHYPTGNASMFDGSRVVAGVTDGGAPCNIKAVSQGAGDSSPSSVFTFKDSASADIEFEDDTFHVFPAFDQAGRWVLTAKAYGDTDISEWESFDLCQTWELIV